MRGAFVLVSSIFQNVKDKDRTNQWNQGQQSKWNALFWLCIEVEQEVVHQNFRCPEQDTDDRACQSADQRKHIYNIAGQRKKRQSVRHWNIADVAVDFIMIIVELKLHR